MAAPTEIYLDWNSDFVLDATGDLSVAQDSIYSAEATTQRLIRTLLTSPRIKASNGQYISVPDDLFNPDFGAGLRAAVDMGFSPKNIAALQTLIFSEIIKDPGVQTTPSPNVNIQLQPGGQTCTLNITFTSVTSQLVALPTLVISAQGN
jgi:hypothetical protein